MSDQARIPQAKDRVVPVLAVESAKYFLVSAAALALDYGLLVGLTEFANLNYLVSAGLGFSAGVVLSYILSVRFVFSERRLESRRLEMMVFFLIGLAGLALNEVLMKTLVEHAGFGYIFAKIPATGIGFVFNFGTRRFFLFTKARRARQQARSDDAVLLPISKKATGSL
jgi:putative flippase GtrA